MIRYYPLKIEEKIKGNLNRLTAENQDKIRLEVLKFLDDEEVIKEIIRKEHPDYTPENVDESCKGLKEPIMVNAIN